MFVLLPPSETKTRPEDSPGASRLDLEQLAHPELTEARAALLRAVVRTTRLRDAAQALKVPASAPELVTRMRHLDAEPVAPALDVYSGVLFDALGDARPRPGRQVLITSALLGVVDAECDLIPAYRLSSSSTVSRLGTVGAWWRPRLAMPARRIAERGRLVVDCRSGTYRAMMRVPGAVEVVAMREQDGQRTVISHDAKRYRGLVARALLLAPEAPQNGEELLAAVRAGLPEHLGIELAPEQLTIIDRA